MGGTVLCDVTDARDGRSAAGFACALARRLGLRLVLVFVTPTVRPGEAGGRGRISAERALAAASEELGGVETRLAFGNHSAGIARVAAEEGADMVIIGSHASGFGGRTICCRLARDLEPETAVPILIAPPSTRKRSEHRLALAADPCTR